MPSFSDDIEIARAAIRQARRDVLKQLMGAAMAEHNPNRREAIMHAISQILEHNR
jgi:hypothetical protein